MKSIHSQLLLWLVPSFIIIAFLASSSLFFTEKQRLDNSLDNELSRLGRAVKLANNMPRNRFGGPRRMQTTIAEKAHLILANTSSEFYLQIWDESGKVIEKSENLKEQQLSHPSSPTKLNSLGNEAISYNSRLTFEGAIRIHSFSMRSEPRREFKNVSIAISKKAINQQLAKFTIKLIVGAIFCCLLLSATLAFSIRRILKPIQNLSEQVTKVEAGSLHNRLSLLDVPKEIRPLVSRLNQLLARLEQSFDRERQFNNDLAHELRTPLAAIRTTSEVALKWPEQSSIDDHQYIAESSAQLQNTIDSLLSLARIENLGEEILAEDVNIITIVNETLALHTNLIEKQNITIAFALDQHHVIHSSPHLLRIIIANLISNAVEYAPINSEVFIKTGSNDSILSVVNMAPNLNEADIKTMFDRLWRKDGVRTSTNHVGLGLAIAHTSAQALSLELTAKLYNDKTLEMRLSKRQPYLLT